MKTFRDYMGALVGFTALAVMLGLAAIVVNDQLGHSWWPSPSDAEDVAPAESAVVLIPAAPQLSPDQIGYCLHRGATRGLSSGSGPFRLSEAFWADWGQGAPLADREQWDAALSAVRRATETGAASAWDFGDLELVARLLARQLQLSSDVTASLVREANWTASRLYSLSYEEALTIK